jgi:hypothetical protein
MTTANLTPQFKDNTKTEKWAIRLLWICIVYIVIKTVIDLV